MFGVGLFPGGYLGVDIFFAISGYLITSIILRELASGKFSLVGFYHRRARRILPALFAVLAVSLVGAWIFLTPNAMASFSGSALSALFFGANFWFLAEDSYWAAPGALKPLLHTWTLAVEEQFYIGFPLLLAAIWKYARRRVLLALLTLFVLSLALSEIGSRSFPDANFYLLPTRAWELLAGALLATLETARGRMSDFRFAKVLPTVGLALVFGSIFFFNAVTPHPSITTMIPVVGVCLVIWFSSPAEPAGKALSSGPFVFVGLISYSLYLWHYPAFAFAHIRYGDLSNLASGALLACVAAVSVVSYFLIEKPCRNKQAAKTRVFAPAIGGAIIVLAIVNGASMSTNGFAARYGELADLFTESGADVMAAQNHNCAGADCAGVDLDGDVFLIGDSHAGVLKHAAAKLAEKHGLKFSARNLGSCVHVDVAHVRYGECDAFRAETDRLIEQEEPLIIIYAVHWRKYQDPTATGKYGGAVTPYEGETLAKAYAKTFKRWLDAGRHLVLIYPGVESEFQVQERIKSLIDKVPRRERAKYMDEMKLTVEYRAQIERAAKEREILNGMRRADGIITVDPLDLFCDDQKRTCALNEGRTLIINDYTHYSRAAAQKVIDAAESKLVEQGWLKAE